MTQSINKPTFDFSDDKKIAKALNNTPAVKAIKAKQGLVPAPKTSAKMKGKAGRIVGISKDENTLLYSLLQAIKSDRQNGIDSYDEIVNKNQEAFDKLIARYNK